MIRPVVWAFGSESGGWRVDKHVRLAAHVRSKSRLDLVGFGSAGVLVALNQGSGTFSLATLVCRGFGYSAAAGGWRNDRHPRFMADVIGNGLDDIVGFANDGVYVAKNRGDGTFDDAKRVCLQYGYSDGAGGWRTDLQPRFMADLTGGGRADIVGFANDGVYVARTRGDGTFEGPNRVCDQFGWGQTAGGWRTDLHPRFMVDLTGDGCADIVGFANDGVYTARNDGQGKFGPIRKVCDQFGCDAAAGGWQTERHPRFMVDVTGDGCADIVGFANDGVYVALNDGHGNFGKPKKVCTQFGYDETAGGWRTALHPRFMVDVTGSGRADIVGFGNDGVNVAVNDGHGNFRALDKVYDQFGHSLGAGGWRTGLHPRFMADMDGTGRADIVGIGNDGVFVATNTGGSFSPCVPPAAVDGPQCWRSIARDTYDKNWTDEVQGVACDQSHWFFSTNSRQLKLGSTPQGIYVFKVGPKLDNQVASIAFKDLPKTFNKRDDEHWGQISYAEDRLYVAYYCYIAENEKRTAVAVFAWDGKQLAFERWILLEPISDGTSTYYPEFQCISPASDLLYSCKGGPNPGVFHAHDPSTGKVVLGKEIRFTGGEGLGLHGNGAQVDIPSEVQGACISPNGHVYMTCNVWIGDDALGKKPVACFSRSTGKLIGMIPIDCPGDFDTHELEGLCYAIVPCGTSSSTLQVVVLRNQTVEFDDLMFEELSADASDRI